MRILLPNFNNPIVVSPHPQIRSITMKNEDKTPLRIVVLGHKNVGKSALTVRYLTRRFIGEYSSQSDLLYRQTLHLDSALLDVEIVDVSSECPVDQVQWADACVVVYSVTDRNSFQYAARILNVLQKQLHHHPVTRLVGNKTDLDHLREVSTEEGAALAESVGIAGGFYDVSVADNSPALYKAFEKLILECKTRPTKQRKFSVSKMIGSLMGNGGSGSGSGGGVQNRQPTLHGSQATVVACPRGELQRWSEMSSSRRRTITSTGSA